MEMLRNRGYHLAVLQILHPNHIMCCDTGALVFFFLPGKYNLPHKMLPTKQLLRKLAYKYPLLNVTRHLDMLYATCTYPV